MPLKKKVQTIKTIVTTTKCTYFIDVDEPDTDSLSSSYLKDTDCLCYEPTDVEVINIEETEEVI